MHAPTRQKIIISEHHEGEIAFLEKCLGGKDWRATVVFQNTLTAPTEINTMAAMLKKRGYGVVYGDDGRGNPALDIHHLGAGGNVGEVFQEQGLLSGIAHAVRHPGDSLGPLVHVGKKAGNWTEGALHNPARANGIINTVAEGFLTAASAGAQYGKFSDPKNALQSLAGISWLSQSLTYLFFAKNNEESAFSRIEKKLDQVVKSGGDITKITYNKTIDKEPDDLSHRTVNFIKRYPVTIGAVANNLGMIAYIGHAILERRFRMGQRALNPQDADALRYIGNGAKGFTEWIKTGFGKDIFGASLSLAGWSVLMIPPRKPEEQSQESGEQSTLTRAWNSFCEHTPQIAGMLTLGASGFRLMGAQSKKNKLQQVGETIYIGGDVELMFTNSHEYGGDGKLDPEKLTNKILEHIGKMPLLMGAQEQKDFVEHTMNFWLDKHKSDLAINDSRHNLTRSLVEKNAVEIKQELMRKLCHQQDERFEHMSECAAEMVMRLPSAQQAAAVQRLSEVLVAMPWMRASAQEMKNGIDHALQKLTSPPTMPPASLENALAADVAAIVNIVPGIDTAVASARIYDAIAPFITPPTPTMRPSTRVHHVADRASLLPLSASPELVKA